VRISACQFLVYTRARAFCRAHHITLHTHPSGLVSSSLFSRFQSCPLAAKPRPRLVDHAPNHYYNSNRFKAGHSLFPILCYQDRLDPRLVARSFPGLQSSQLFARPFGNYTPYFNQLFSVASKCPPPLSKHLQLPVTKEIPCRILGQLCDTTCISVTTTADIRHDRNHDNTLLLVHVSALTHRSTEQARHLWEIDSSTPTSKLAPIFEPQRASIGTLTTDSTHSNPTAGARRKSSTGFWGSVMSSRKPTHFQTDSAHSAKIAVYSSTADCDADDEATMSAEEAPQQQRPATIHMAASAPASATSLTRPIPSETAPFCPRRPNLREILANTAPAPWTLAAFMAYLSNNHCLETLEFTMDAGRYKKHFHRMMNKAPIPGQPTEHDANYVKELWTRLMEAYIQPNGSREVNLPSQVRDPILGHKPANTLPPEPSVLEPAVSKTYELMEESVLVPFLNSVYPQSPTPVSPYYPNNSNESMITPVEEKSSRFGRRSRHSSRGSPPPLSASSVEFSASSYSPPSLNNRKSAPSALTTALSRHRFSTKLSPTSSAPSHSLSAALSTTSSASDAIYSGPGLTDDSGSSGSPINDCPMTPPVTPPMGDISGSPRTHRDSGAWKKLGRLSGWKPSRKRSQPGFDLHTT
jgi:hypothetical protein